MGKSFDISNSKEYLEHLLDPSFTELGKEPTSSRLAIVAAITCWHLHDWVWAEHKTRLRATLGFHSKEDFVGYLVANCPAFEAIQGIANGSKHFRSEQREAARAGRVAAHTSEAIAKEAATHRKHAQARDAWNPATQPTWLTDQVFSEKIQPALAQASASAIAKRIAVSRWYAGRIREGYRPHPRHWLALAALVGIER
jgi:hypothetical protein